MKTQTEERKELIKRIHCGWRWAKIYQHDRDLYELMLSETFPETFEKAGKISCTALSIPQLRQLADFMRSPEVVVRKTQKNRMEKPLRITEKQWRYICFLQDKLGWNAESVRDYMRTVCKIDHERFMAVSHARSLITGMKRISEYKKK